MTQKNYQRKSLISFYLFLKNIILYQKNQLFYDYCVMIIRKI